MNFVRHMSNNTESTLVILELYNGNYIDHGYVQLAISLQELSGAYTHTKGNYTFYSLREIGIKYNYYVKLSVILNDKGNFILIQSYI